MRHFADVHQCQNSQAPLVPFNKTTMQSEQCQQKLSRHPSSLSWTPLSPAGRSPLATLLGNLMASQRRCWKYRCVPFSWMVSHHPGGDRYVRHRASLSCFAFCPTAGGGIAAECWSFQLWSLDQMGGHEWEDTPMAFEQWFCRTSLLGSGWSCSRCKKAGPSGTLLQTFLRYDGKWQGANWFSGGWALSTFRRRKIWPLRVTLELVSTSLWLKGKSKRRFDFSRTSSVNCVAASGIKQIHRRRMIYQYIDMHQDVFLRELDSCNGRKQLQTQPNI